MWKWKYFFIYLGAMMLLLVVLPALLVGGAPDHGNEEREEEEEEERIAMPLSGEYNWTVQIYLKEQGEIVEMDLEVYTAGVVAAEMPPSFHGEALKAQAVAARTYALQKVLPLGGRGCASQHGADLCTDSTCCQAWDSVAARLMALNISAEFSGAGVESTIIREISAETITDGNTVNHYYARVIKAVAITKGLVVCYGGDYIEAVYHSTCGGITAAASEVWGNDFPYLQPVEDHFCSHSPYYRQELRLEMPAFLAAMGMNMEDREAIPVLAGLEPLLEVSHKGASGRKTLLLLPPRRAERSLSGTEFRRLLGLPSTFFHWTVEEDEIIFHTRGFGHGAGLCQYGADGMAQAGSNFQEILEYYYRGAVVQPNHIQP